MQLHTGGYFHIYNRSNGSELVFREEENYFYFLRLYRRHLSAHFTTIAYCLMPTHFHFLAQVKSESINEAQNAVGILLSSYTKAINHRYARHGSLFQRHSKAKWVVKAVMAMACIHAALLRAPQALRKSCARLPDGGIAPRMEDRQHHDPLRLNDIED